MAVAEITDRMRTLTTLRGDSEAGSRIAVGRLLAKLGVRRDHTKLRNVVVFDGTNQHAMHQAAWARGVLTEVNLLPGCLHCEMLAGKPGLAIGNEQTANGPDHLDIGGDTGEESERSEGKMRL